jgi:hypothetical protein
MRFLPLPNKVYVDECKLFSVWALELTYLTRFKGVLADVHVKKVTFTQENELGVLIGLRHV